MWKGPAPAKPGSAGLSSAEPGSAGLDSGNLDSKDLGAPVSAAGAATAGVGLPVGTEVALAAATPGASTFNWVSCAATVSAICLISPPTSPISAVIGWVA